MVEFEFLKRDGTDPLTIIDDDIVSLNATLTNTGVATFRATISGDRRLESRAQRQDRINIKTGGDTKFAGILTNVSHTRSSGDTEVSGKGIAKLLQEGRPDYQANGGPIVYDNVFAGDAIEDYWSRTPFGNVTVTPQTATVVVSDSLTQSADTTTEWQNELQDIDATTPLYIENGSLKQAQSGFVFEAEDAISRTAGLISRTDFSDGEGVLYNDVNDVALFSVTTNYNIENLDVYVRCQEITAGDFTTLEIYDSDDDTQYTGGISPSDTLGWANSGLSGSFDGSFGFELEPNRTLAADGQTYGEVEVDAIAFVDDRFSYTFDNTLNTSSGYLDGPAEYPTDANPIAVTEPDNTTRNIASATVTTTFNDTTNDQRLGLSDDGGTTFQRGSNTNSFTASFSDAGRQLVTEFRLSGYDNGVRNQTPRLNYLGQEVDSFETAVDLDNRVVFVGVEVSKNHFENLQKLHSSSDFVWTIEHDSSDPANIPVFSFPRGEETRTLSQINDNEIEESPAVEGAQFYNVIPLQGGLDAQGNRPFAEVKDQDSINDIGTEISPGLLRDPTISSDIEARFIAQGLLKKALKNGDLRGTKTVPATFAPIPGFAYPVSWLDDQTTEVTLEETSVTKSRGTAETRLDFTGRTGFAQEIDELRRNARETQDEV